MAIDRIDLLVEILGIPRDEIFIFGESSSIERGDTLSIVDGGEIKNTDKDVIQYIKEELKKREAYEYERGQDNIRIALKQPIGVDIERLR